MKKTILFTLLGLAFAAGSASAATDTSATYSGATSIGGMAFTSSNNVSVWYQTGDTFRAYLAGSSHGSGSRSYGTSSGDANIFYVETSMTWPSVSVPAAGATAGFTWSKI